MRAYVDILKTPGALAFCLAGLLARAGGAMMGIGTVLMVRMLYGSYSLAGVVSAANTVCWALGSPIIARLVDRLGQRRVMLPATMMSLIMLATLVICATLRIPGWILIFPAALSGLFSGSIGPLVRARWSHVLSNQRQLHTAFSLEGALDELNFIIGPVLATWLATTLFPSSGLIAPIIVTLVGALVFFNQRSTEPPIKEPQEEFSDEDALIPGLGSTLDVDDTKNDGSHTDARANVATDSVAPRSSPSSPSFDSTSRPRRPSQRRRLTPAILLPGVMPVAAVSLVIGCLFGVNDLTVVAITEEWGQPDKAGLVLAAFSVGSMISGFGYGARNWATPVWKRLSLTTIALVLTAGLLVATSVGSLAFFGFIAGFAIAPNLINAMAVVHHIIPHDRMTEGLSWMNTATGVGVSLGSSAGGIIVDHLGATAGFVSVVVLAGVTMVVAFAATPTLTRVAESLEFSVESGKREPADQEPDDAG
ncbi:MAG: MFS transporter [Propionibacteriaceae bacterium]|jgi:MFS family permease|nr:MFS transporter [Propionibacteriaceae bacterium]